jgi:predicted GNAT family acetyltransferase
MRDGRVVGVAMHTPPYHLFLPRLPAGVAVQIALALINSQHAVDDVNGETTTVAEFAETWTEQTGGRAVIVMAQRMYRLKELIHPRSSSGEVRRARPDDRDLLVDWFTRFHAEATPGRPGEAPASTVDRRLGGGQLWLWWDGGGPVSVAGISPAVAGVARVGPVYTPPQHRRRGYGTAITASATEAALRAGSRHVVLYTDLTNPTSNAIYQAIGYVPDHDAEDRQLLPLS